MSTEKPRNDEHWFDPDAKLHYKTIEKEETPEEAIAWLLDVLNKYPEAQEVVARFRRLTDCILSSRKAEEIDQAQAEELFRKDVLDRATDMLQALQGRDSLVSKFEAFADRPGLAEELSLDLNELRMDIKDIRHSLPPLRRVRDLQKKLDDLKRQAETKKRLLERIRNRIREATGI